MHYDRIVLKTVFKRKIRLGLEYVENLYHPIIKQYQAQKIGRKSERNVESLYQAIIDCYRAQKIGRKSETNVEISHNHSD